MSVGGGSETLGMVDEGKRRGKSRRKKKRICEEGGKRENGNEIKDPKNLLNAPSSIIISRVQKTQLIHRFSVGC